MKIVVSVLICVLLASAAFERNVLLKTPYLLWQDVAKKNPICALVRNNLGNSYLLLGKYQEAIEEYEKAISINKYYLPAYFNLADAYEKIGLNDRAVYYMDFYCAYATLENSERRELACRRSQYLKNASAGR
jgi:tetratricopeptide (TPR) repeat protein